MLGFDAVNAETLERLDEIAARCEPYKRICNALLRFRVSIGREDVRFNARAAIDIIYLATFLCSTSSTRQLVSLQLYSYPK